MVFDGSKPALAVSEARDGTLAEVNRPARETSLERIRDWAAIWAAVLVFFTLMVISFNLLLGCIFAGGAAVAAGTAVWALLRRAR